MLPLTSEYIDRLVGRQLLNTAKGSNNDVYDKRLTAKYSWPPFAKVPRFIYFYYLTLGDDNKLRVDHYHYNMGPDLKNPVEWDPIPHDKVPPILDELTRQARPGGGGVPLPDHNFQNVKWTRRSYIAFVVDEPSWNLHKRSSGNSAVVFNVDKPGEPNHSFFDALDIEVRVATSARGFDTRSGVYFVNHMTKDSEGTPLDRSETMFFDMYCAVNYDDPFATPVTVIVDPTGTNQGPPEPPDGIAVPAPRFPAV